MPTNVRFGDLVRNSGRPSVHALWTKPSRDKAFAQALKQNHVLERFLKVISESFEQG